MKLSAPPPPPPPPPEQPAPGAPQPPDPAASAPPPPPEAAPPAPDANKPAVWPAWYAGFDSLLAALALVVAFACGSFAAHNSDAWLHLAAGKKLFAGEYFPGGGDPFSYAAEGRAWVNHSWLTDAVAYLLYSGDGKVLVVAKALLLVLALGLLMGLRRAPHSLWPWAVVSAVAALAAAPQLMLRPLVVSLPFLAVTLFLLFRVKYRPDSLRFPGLIAGTFWLWANCDQWFFLGPLALALVALGEAIQAKAFANPEVPAPEGEVEPLGRYPELPLLLKALVFGVVACTLTPHHVRVWELPVELTGLAGLADDPRFRPLLYAPVDSAYVSNAGLGYNLNGLAYAVLFVLGAIGLGFGPGRVRAAHLALWIGFAALALLSVYAIPFFALVSVPLVAAQLNALSAGATLKATGDPRTQVLLIGSTVGRVACLLAGAGLCVAAYPGWIHPDTTNPAFARRLAWAVVPEPGLQRGAEQLGAWRASGALPADARGVIVHPDLANYVAWFAPGEKVLFNSRVGHHKPELADYFAARAAFGLLDTRDPRDRKFDLRAAADVLKKLGAEYLVLHAGPADGAAARGITERAALFLTSSTENWTPWLSDGRTAAFGWRGAGQPTAAALKLDPVALAYAPGAARLPEYELKPPLELGWEEPFVRAPRAAPVAAAEALGWLRFKLPAGERLSERARQRRSQQFQQQFASVLTAAPGVGEPTWHLFAARWTALTGLLQLPVSATETEDARTGRACALLALRAARRAIAEDPDHPDGYGALAQVLRDPDAPFTEGERALGTVIACRQYLDRVAKPDRYRRAQVTVPASDMALLLADMYTGQQIQLRDPGSREPRFLFVGLTVDVPGFADLFGGFVVETPRGPQRAPQLPPGARSFTGNTPVYFAADAALDALQLAQQYLAADSAGLDADVARDRAAGLEAGAAAVKRSVVEARAALTLPQGAKLPTQVIAAYRSGLPLAALELLRGADTDLQKEFGNQVAEAAVLRAALELLCGRAENGAELLNRLTDPAAGGNVPPRAVQFKYQQALHLGDYRGAGRLIEEYDGRNVGTDELLKGVARAKVTPTDLLRGPFAEWPPRGPGTGWAAAVFRHEWDRRASESQIVRQLLDRKLEADSNFFFRRGQLALLEGDIPGAKARFEQAKRTPPPGWYLEPVDQPAAREYLELIDRAARGKK